jgi:biotin operon repressor
MDELVLLSLSPAELRVFLALRHTADRWSESHVSMEELTELTGYGRTSLSKAVQGLQDAGLISIQRTKRNYGRLSKNVYVLPRSPERTSVDEEPRSVDRTPTASSIAIEVVKTTKLSRPVTTVTTVEKDTSYLFNGSAVEKENMNRWTDDDDNIGGFGLLDGETPSAQKSKPVSKRDSKTRHLRPQHEWTANDMASEFASRLYEKVRGIPGLVNISRLAPVLGKYRKERGTTALYELEVMDLMMMDEGRLRQVKQDPANAWKIYLRMLATHGQKALTKMGVDDVSLDIEPANNYVYASDGRKFDNSMPGRAALERYENKIK